MSAGLVIPSILDSDSQMNRMLAVLQSLNTSDADMTTLRNVLIHDSHNAHTAFYCPEHNRPNNVRLMRQLIDAAMEVCSAEE